MRMTLLAAVFTATVSTAQAVELGDAGRRLDYARETCAECHAIHADEFESPIVEAPGFEEIANLPAMSRLALISFFQTSHELMPNFVIPPEEVDNLVAYILSLKD